MDNHTFTIRLAAAHMNVDTLSLRELAELLEAFHSLLGQAAVTGDTGPDTEPLHFSLVGVKESGSISYLVLANQREKGRAIYRQATSLLNRRHTERHAAKLARKLQDLAARWKTPVECYDVGATTPDVVIGVNELVDSPKISSETVLYGELMRVGGREPKAVLRVGKHSLIMEVNRKFARELAPKLYQPVGLKGVATWDMETWEIVHFEPKELLEYEPVPCSQAFEELAQASPRAWTREFLDTIPDFYDYGVGEE